MNTEESRRRGTRRFKNTNFNNCMRVCPALGLFASIFRCGIFQHKIRQMAMADKSRLLSPQTHPHPFPILSQPRWQPPLPPPRPTRPNLHVPGAEHTPHAVVSFFSPAIWSLFTFLLIPTDPMACVISRPGSGQWAETRQAPTIPPLLKPDAFPPLPSPNERGGVFS